jgi:oxygen-independent coproporphyrinogen-3 oxidase
MSIGVQSFQNELTGYLGRARSHTRDRSLNSIMMIRQAGIENINVDLMYGIPGQTMDSWDDDIDHILELPIISVSAMLYLVLPGSDTFFKIQNGQIPTCPSSKEQDQMYWRFTERVLSNGYYALTNYDFFGGPWLQHRKDLDLTTYSIQNQRSPKLYEGLDTSSCSLTHYLDHQWSKGMDRVAIGSGAYGDLNHHLYLNEPDIERYITMCNQGQNSICVGSYLNEQERMAKSMVLGVKLLRIKRSDFIALHGVDMYEVFKPQIDDLVDKQLVELNEEALQVTYPKGWFYLNNISKAFYSESQYRLPQPDSTSTEYLIWKQKKKIA